MDKHTNIHSDVTAVKVMLLKHAVRNTRVLHNEKRNHTVINAFVGNQVKNVQQHMQDMNTNITNN